MEKRWRALIGIAVATTVVGIDYSIVNTSLANIQRDLHVLIGQLQWIMIGFGLFFSALMITMGRLADLRGRRKFFYSGMIGLSLASLAAGLATSPLFLILMRMLQGVFASIILPCGVSIIAVMFDDREQVRALSIYGSLIGIGLAIGPVLGALIMSVLSWRWIFFINIPFGVVSFLICLPVLRESKLPHAMPVDWPGVITLTLFLGSLIFSLSQGRYYGWSSAPIMLAFAFSMVMLIGFIVLEQFVKYPLIPIEVLSNRYVILGLMNYFGATSLSWPIMFLIPIYLHNVLSFPTGVVGILLFPMTIMTVFSPIPAGYYYNKFGALGVVSLLFIFVIVSLIIFMNLSAKIALGWMMIAFLLFGAAWGMSNSLSSPLALTKVDNRQNSGLIAGTLTTLSSLMGVILVAADITLFDYGQQISFVHGMRLAMGGLLGCAILFWFIFLLVKLSGKEKV